MNMDAATTSALERRQIAAAKEATLNSASLGILGLRGRYVSLDPKATGAGSGIVHLYRDVLRSTDLDGAASDSSKDGHHDQARTEEAYVDKDKTTLCILAVPSHMTPSALLSWFGEGTLELISNVRLVKTSRANRYMVLLKFRNTWSARQKQKEWSGKSFNNTEVNTKDSLVVAK